jgi:hypothetical protein
MAELTRVSRDTDFEEIAAFQRRAFGHQWLKSERRRLQRAEYYGWKYFPPAGPALMATIRSRQELVAMVAAVPFALTAGAECAWQICDIATLPQFRQRGFFARCLTVLDTAVAADATFCFPNRQSRAGLIKAGYAVRSLLSVRARPLLPRLTNGTGAPGPGSVELDECGAAFATNGTERRIARTPEFLRWRYGAHPLNRYAALRATSALNDSCVVVRHLFNGRLSLIVDVSSTASEALRAQRAAARQWAQKTGCSALLWTRSVDVTAGGISVMSARQMPWHVVCYAKEPVESSSPATAGHFEIRFGDWDAI